MPGGRGDDSSGGRGDDSSGGGGAPDLTTSSKPSTSSPDRGPPLPPHSATTADDSHTQQYSSLTRSSSLLGPSLPPLASVQRSQSKRMEDEDVQRRTKLRHIEQKIYFAEHTQEAHENEDVESMKKENERLLHISLRRERSAAAPPIADADSEDSDDDHNLFSSSTAKNVEKRFSTMYSSQDEGNHSKDNSVVSRFKSSKFMSRKKRDFEGSSLGATGTGTAGASTASVPTPTNASSSVNPMTNSSFTSLFGMGGGGGANAVLHLATDASSLGGGGGGGGSTDFPRNPDTAPAVLSPIIRSSSMTTPQLESTAEFFSNKAAGTTSAPLSPTSTIGTAPTPSFFHSDVESTPSRAPSSSLSRPISPHSPNVFTAKSGTEAETLATDATTTAVPLLSLDAAPFLENATPSFGFGLANYYAPAPTPTPASNEPELIPDDGFGFGFGFDNGNFVLSSRRIDSDDGDGGGYGSGSKKTNSQRAAGKKDAVVGFGFKPIETLIPKRQTRIIPEEFAAPGAQRVRLHEVVDRMSFQNATFIEALVLCKAPLNPRAPSKRVWNILIILCVYYILCVTPFEVAFLEDYTKPTLIIGVVVDIMFIFDVVVSFRTGVEIQEDLFIRDSIGIAKHYLQTLFIFDFIAAFPYNTLISVLIRFGVTTSIYYWFNLIKLLKLVSIIKLKYPSQLLRGTKLSGWRSLCIFFLFYLLTALWMACLWWWVGKLEGYENSWIGKTSALLDLSNRPIAEQFTVSFYWAVTTMTTLGYGDVSAKTYAEQVYATVVIVIGASMYAVVIGLTSYTLKTYFLSDMDFDAQFNSIRAFIKHYHLDRELKDRITEYYETLWSRRKAMDSSALVMEDLPLELRADVADAIHKRLINMNPLLRSCTSTGFKHIFAARLSQAIIRLRDDFIFFEGHEVSDVYFVRSGTVEIISGLDTDNEVVVGRRSDGQHCGDIGLFLENYRAGGGAALGDTDDGRYSDSDTEQSPAKHHSNNPNELEDDDSMFGGSSVDGVNAVKKPPRRLLHRTSGKMTEFSEINCISSAVLLQLLSFENFRLEKDLFMAVAQSRFEYIRQVKDIHEEMQKIELAVATNMPAAAALGGFSGIGGNGAGGGGVPGPGNLGNTAGGFGFTSNGGLNQSRRARPPVLTSIRSFSERLRSPSTNSASSKQKLFFSQALGSSSEVDDSILVGSNTGGPGGGAVDMSPASNYAQRYRSLQRRYKHLIKAETDLELIEKVVQSTRIELSGLDFTGSVRGNSETATRLLLSKSIRNGQSMRNAPSLRRIPSIRAATVNAVTGGLDYGPFPKDAISMRESTDFQNPAAAAMESYAKSIPGSDLDDVQNPFPPHARPAGLSDATAENEGANDAASMASRSSAPTSPVFPSLVKLMPSRESPNQLVAPSVKAAAAASDESSAEDFEAKSPIPVTTRSSKRALVGGLSSEAVDAAISLDLSPNMSGQSHTLRRLSITDDFGSPSSPGLPPRRASFRKRSLTMEEPYLRQKNEPASVVSTELLAPRGSISEETSSRGVAAQLQSLINRLDKLDSPLTAKGLMALPAPGELSPTPSSSATSPRGGELLNAVSSSSYERAHSSSPPLILRRLQSDVGTSETTKTKMKSSQNES